MVNPDGAFAVWLSGYGVRLLDASIKPSVIAAPKVAHGHMVFTRSGDLFTLTFGHGLIHFMPETSSARKIVAQEAFTPAEGLQSPYLSCLLEDREGNLWLGTTKGLERFRNSKFVGMPIFAGDPGTVLLPDEGDAVWAGLRTGTLALARSDDSRELGIPPITGITCAFQDTDGSAWFGASPLLWHVVNKRAERIRLPSYVQGSSDIQAIARDASGRLWVSVVRFGTATLDHGIWKRGDTDGPDYALAYFLDAESRFWSSYHGHLVVRVRDSVHHLTSADGLDFGDVLSFASRGGLLVVGAERGLGLYRRSRFQKVHTDHDELLRGVSGLVFSPDGALWLHGTEALLRISPEDLSLFEGGKLQSIRSQVFSFQEGLPGLAPAVRPFPSIILSHDGRIWVSTTSGVAWLDPLHYPRNSIPPEVRLSVVRADGRAFDPATPVALRPRTRSILVEYTAPSLSVSDGIHFRYRLDGFDTEWQEAGTLRSARYNGLPPGNYTFRVQADNGDGIWNPAGASLPLSVAPAFYQRMWFHVFCWVLAFLLIWLVYRIRLQVVTTRLRALLAERLSERERIAAELHDTLLQSVQGLILLFSGVAAQLPAESPVSDRVESAIQRAEHCWRKGATACETCADDTSI